MQSYMFFMGDYAMHTRHLNLIEDLTYRRLLDYFYITEKPLLLSIEKLSKLIGMPDANKEVKSILDEFFVKNESGYINNRAQNEINKYNIKVSVAIENGKKGGRPTSNSEKKNSNDAIEIYKFWKKTMRKSDISKFTEKRKKAVNARLKNGYTVDEIKEAITGCSITPHNIGINAHEKRYDCLELICRSDENLERFITNATSSTQNNHSMTTLRNVNNIHNLELK